MKSMPMECPTEAAAPCRCRRRKRQRPRSSRHMHKAMNTGANRSLLSFFFLLALLVLLIEHIIPYTKRGSVVSGPISRISIVPGVRADDDILAELLREEAEADADDYYAGSADGTGSEYGEDKYDRPPPDMRDGTTHKRGGMPGTNGGRRRPTMPGSSSGSGGGGGGSSPHESIEEELRQKEEAAAKIRQQRQEEEEARIAEQHRLEREAAFEAEVARMDEENRKRALRQKKADAKIVNTILRAAKAKPEPRHYAVLGIRNWHVSVGPVSWFAVDTKTIKRAYRNLSRKVHPDKNRDGRAEEAFHALEASAAVLSDSEQRTSYDRRVAARRRKRTKRITGGTMEAFEVGRRSVTTAVGTVRRALGPFSTPIFVLGALII